MNESQRNSGQVSDVMDAVSKAVDVFYTHFILRDILGKALPALALVIPLLFSVVPPEKIQELTQATWFWVGLLSISWCFAFFIQELGLCTKGLFVRSFKYNRNYYETKMRFNRCASPADKNQLERIIVVRECCGIAALAIFLGAVYWVLHLYFKSGSDAFSHLSKRTWLLPTGIATLTLGFWLANRQRARRHDDLIDAVLGVDQVPGSVPAA